MQLVLVSGAGGAGRTTAAAATAADAAARGHKVLVVTTGRVGSLAAAYGAPPNAEPVEVDTGLVVAGVDLRLAAQRAAPVLGPLAAGAGVSPLTAKELTQLPGVPEALALEELAAYAGSDRHDLLVVDAPATPAALRLLAAPDTLGWYLRRVHPMERRIAAALQPRGSPQERVLAGLDRLADSLAAARGMLAEPGVASVRLVATPDAAGAAAAARARAAFALHRLPVDAVVVRALEPDPAADGWRRARAAAQADGLAALAAAVAPVPVCRLPELPTPPAGPAALAELGAALAVGADPLTPPAERLAATVRPDGDDLVFTVPLPGVRPADVDVVRAGRSCWSRSARTVGRSGSPARSAGASWSSGRPPTASYGSGSARTPRCGSLRSARPEQAG